MTAKKATETTETTQKPDEQLALKLGFKTTKGKGNVTALKDALLNIALSHSDSIGDIEQIDKAIKLYSNNGIAKRNQEQTQKTTQKIEDAIKECLENDLQPTKTYLNKRYGINYTALKKYQEENPDKLTK